jgi:glutamate 5-kinase
MQSKIRAAEIIMRSGEMMIIANGGLENVLSRLMKGENIGTIFIDKNSSLSSRKRWIAFNMKTKGKIRIDAGAVAAICERKKSLLSSGIIDCEGTFVLGDAVEIVDENWKLIGKGIVNYNKSQLKQIGGKKTGEIREILGDDYYDEVINRDDLIIY